MGTTVMEQVSAKEKNQKSESALWGREAPNPSRKRSTKKADVTHPEPKSSQMRCQ